MALPAVRATKLAEARLIVQNQGRDPTSEEITGYDLVKNDLWQMQGYKCAYCEAREQAKRNDVEHFRPKGRAERGPGHPRHGYWWLAWTWDNLLFACRNCNQSPAKLDKFPLAPGSVALVAEAPAPGAEIPLLLDPCVDEPRDHIVFRPRGASWVPVARDGSAKGEATIRVCCLDRADLVTLYDAHVAALRDDLTALDAALTLADAAAVDREWSLVRRRWLHRRQAFVALSCDAILQLLPGLSALGISPAPWT